MLSNSIVLYSLVSSNSFQIVPFNLVSGNLDQLKLFNGLDGCGIFFLASSIFMRGSAGGPLVAQGGGGGPGGPGGGGGAKGGGGGGTAMKLFLHSAMFASRFLFKPITLASSGMEPELTRRSRRCLSPLSQFTCRSRSAARYSSSLSLQNNYYVKKYKLFCSEVELIQKIVFDKIFR